MGNNPNRYKVKCTGNILSSKVIRFAGGRLRFLLLRPRIGFEYGIGIECRAVALELRTGCLTTPPVVLGDGVGIDSADLTRGAADDTIVAIASKLTATEIDDGGVTMARVGNRDAIGR